MVEIGFLHLSDLHIGNKYQSGLISQSKKILFEDISFILSKTKALDVVFFTGDCVQTGTKDEFCLFEEFLNDLWQLFNKCGQNPYLVCVPGNHDLERIHDFNNPIQKVLGNWVEENIKDDYFWNGTNSYYEFIKERFKNYEEWYRSSSVPKPSVVTGYIPGDFYVSLPLKGINLGIVGLNSTFLQLHGGDVKKKLGVYNKQVNFLFKERYFEWVKQQDFSVLLTHHSPEWFEPKSSADFNNEIYCQEAYIEHLCGHMHEPLYTAEAINGFPAKRMFVSPSLFGLEHYEGKQSRIHGYTAGIYSLEQGKVIKTIWPRISIQTKLGLKISRNEDFNLDKDSASLTEVLTDSQLPPLEKVEEESEKLSSIDNENGNLFSKDAITTGALARTLYKEIPSYTNIRFQERDFAINSLTGKNYCWIVSAFGLGEQEFVGSILNGANINPENCFSLNCDELSTKEELIEVFKSTFSQNITRFFEIINFLDRPLLVFNNLSNELVKNITTLKEFIETIFDFSPNCKIVIIAEVAPDRRFFDYIELFPLDTPAVKQFIEKSQEIQSSFTYLEYEKIHRISSGIPLYVEKVMEQLKFRPLSDLGDMELNSSSDVPDSLLPKALANEIKLLNKDDTKQGLRRFALLSVLSLLHNGEVYERIKRLYPDYPFHPDDISYLLKNKLIETYQINSIFEKSISDNELIKVIRVPRAVRDYISSLLSEYEKVECYKQACNLYLGSNWRTTIKLVKTKDAELDLIVHQNLQVAIRFILSYGIQQGNELEVNRMLGVATSLISYFSDRGSYKDAVYLAEETLILIKDVQFDCIDDTRIHLMKKLGENLRMSSIHSESISILQSICDDDGNSLSKSDRNDVRLSIAYAYETQGNKEEAIRYATLIKDNEKNKETATYLSAESVIAHFIEDDAEKLRRLTSIKNKAERLGFNTVKANLVFDILKLAGDESQLKHLDKIISESKDDTYNKVRALVVKAEILFAAKSFDKVTDSDLLGLNISYSYAFHQRLQTLLNKCHRLAWQYWSEQSRFDYLLTLFRYSSFVWRLCGSLEQEKKYIDELHSDLQFLEWFKSNKKDINSTYYEQRIFALYNNSNR